MSSHHTAPRREWRTQNGWLAGIMVIAIGVLFLLHNLGLPLVLFEYRNGWSVVILLASLAPLTLAYRHYREAGRVHANTLFYLTSAAAVLTVGFVFLLHLGWDRWWPLFVIYGGCWMLVRRTYRRVEAGGGD